MLRVGLTGSIGMGKSTTAAMFAALGIPVHDADRVVHQLYQDPAIVTKIEVAFPGSTVAGTVDRSALGAIVLHDPSAMRRLESMVHPLVREAEMAFVERSKDQKSPYVVFDIPLLFETQQQDRFDVIIVVSADPETQRERVLAREAMTVEKFEAILAKQMPDTEKRSKADYIVTTNKGLDNARAQVAAIHESLCKRAAGLSI